MISLTPAADGGDPYTGTGGARPRPYNPPVAAAALAFGEVLRRTVNPAFFRRDEFLTGSGRPWTLAWISPWVVDYYVLL